MNLAEFIARVRTSIDDAVWLVLSVEVIHFTDDAHRAAIDAAGFLVKGTWVTRPQEVQGLTPIEVEERLEVQPGRGGNWYRFRVHRKDLQVPSEGSRTSKGAWQRQLARPYSTAGAWRHP